MIFHSLLLGTEWKISFNTTYHFTLFLKKNFNAFSRFIIFKKFLKSTHINNSKNLIKTKLLNLKNIDIFHCSFICFFRFLQQKINCPYFFKEL